MAERTRDRSLLVIAVILGWLGWAAFVGPAGAAEPRAETAPIPMVAVGDMAVCGSDASVVVSSMLDHVAGNILALGDLAYPDGSAEDFAECFDPVFGRHRDRMLPVVGNHEYHTPGAAGYADYFGTAAGPRDQFWYVEQQGDWQVLVLNSNCSRVGCGTDSEQYRWLEAQLAASPNTCRVAAFHHPRWTSHHLFRDNHLVDPFVRLLQDAGTDLILSGHGHHYERFEQQTADAELSDDNGFHHFVVGTGGVALRPTTHVAPNSAVRAQAHGILELSLAADSFSWTFRTADGEVLDRGTDDCVHGQEPQPEPLPEPEPQPEPESEPLAPPVDSQLHRLYLAVFLRTPDASGLEYWLAQRQAGTTLRGIATFFTESPEFMTRYGALDDGAFVELLYTNVLGRSPDQAGEQYWRGELAAGMSRGETVLLFSDSPEFIASTGT